MIKFFLNLLKSKKLSLLEEYDLQFQSIDIYRALIKSYLEISEAVYGRYSSSRFFVPPDYYLSLRFSKVIQQLKTYQEYSVLSDLPQFDFGSYIDLNIDNEIRVLTFPEKRAQTIKYQSEVEHFFFRKCKTNGRLPKNVESDIEYTHYLVKQHLSKRGKIQKNKDISEGLLLNFKARDSKKKKIFMVLQNQFDEWVDTHTLEKIGMSYDSLRSFIAQLQSDLNLNYPNKRYAIIAAHGCYKLTDRI